MPQAIELPDWVPDWMRQILLPSSPPGARNIQADQDPISTVTPQIRTRANTPEQTSQVEVGHKNGENGFSRSLTKQLIVTPNQDRLVKRKLKGIHLFVSELLPVLMVLFSSWDKLIRICLVKLMP
jgi:hypothetical protein